MKISVKTLRRLIKEELINEINAAGLPQVAKSFQEVPSLQKGFSDLTRTFKNVIVMQAIVQNNPQASTMANEQLDQLAQQYDATATKAAATFQQQLSEFLDDAYVEAVRSMRSTRQAAPVQAPAPQATGPAAKPATGTAPDQRQTIAPPRM